jgi:hypothetical protein
MIYPILEYPKLGYLPLLTHRFSPQGGCMQGWIAPGLTLMIAGCAGPVPANRDEAAAQIAVVHDPYTKGIGLATEGFQVPDVVGPASASASFIGSISTTNNAAWVALRVTYNGPSWIFFSTATDIDGTRFNFESVDRSVGRGSSLIMETFQIKLSRSYMEQHRATGMNIRFNGKYGSLVVPMPAVYVDGFLQRFDGEKSKLNR